MNIKNFSQLATSEIKKQTLLIAEAGLDAISTKQQVEQNFSYDPRRDEMVIQDQIFSLDGYKRVIVVGAGKVVAQTAEVVEKKLGARLSAGAVIDIIPAETSTIESYVGTHPLPSKANIAATQKIIDLVTDSTEEDFIIALIGGGGSSLLSAPANISLEEERKIFKALLKSGADIFEMNTVRKHISSVKGGGLAQMAFPARMVSMIFSDVPGDDIEYVASGPTVQDTTTMHDAAQILDKYKILMHCEMEVCGLEETPKQEKYFKNVTNILFQSAQNTLKAMSDKAHDLGFKVKVWDEAYRGEASELGPAIVAESKAGQCLLGIGESTVTISAQNKFHGIGGRNQEMALAAAQKIKDETVFMAMSSDGHDNSDVAGAIVDSGTIKKLELLGFKAEEELANHNSYQPLLDAEASVVTGITGANVSDFFICLK